MARIQQKSSGRRRPAVRLEIDSREFKRASEESLVKRGATSVRWGDYRGKKKSPE